MSGGVLVGGCEWLGVEMKGQWCVVLQVTDSEWR